ncbi:hypothetical protein WMO40_13325 [Bacillaceae bacterium CLA-AA-H227]|uniref:Uncharacterized protein n=2 Tax=Robertmurraya TaxID=2837507 RepID=A0A4U1CZU5_9BACI|nr:hypothetical protein [Robertmurraya kyonggiensis]TKC14998.1 hypothetical protein FA727_19055 [Robertmurraya kyonggiensis]
MNQNKVSYVTSEAFLEALSDTESNIVEVHFDFRKNIGSIIFEVPSNESEVEDTITLTYTNEISYHNALAELHGIVESHFNYEQNPGYIAIEQPEEGVAK